METGAIDPIALEEKKMLSLVEKIKSLEARLREKEIIVDRLRELIAKCHSDSFPPEIKIESERRY